MFTSTAFLNVENDYRREQLRRAWGGPTVLRLRQHRWAAVARRAHRPAHRRVPIAGGSAVAGAR